MWEIILFFIQINNAELSSQVLYNTIHEVQTRVTAYSPRVISKTCLLKPQHGPCRGNINMYYYKPEIKDCQTFEWSGCQGNGNRFDSKEQCLDTCLSKPNAPNMRRPKWCSLSFDYGFCFGTLQRWYYDSRWKVCKETIYSGCGGNKNNFYSIEQCDSICRFGNGVVRNALKTKGNFTKVLIINPAPTNKTKSNEISLNSIKSNQTL